MDQKNTVDQTAAPMHTAETATGAAEPVPSFADYLKILNTEFSGALRSGRELVLTESRLFGYSLGLIIALAVIISFFIGPLWIFLGAAAAFFLVQQFALTPVAALLIIAAIFLLLIVMLGVWIYRLTRHLKFHNTRRAVANLLASVRQDASEEQP